MNNLRYVIGIDIGTTSTKAVLFTENGDTVCSHAIGYPLHTTTTDAAEQDQIVIFSAVITTVRQVIA